MNFFNPNTNHKVSLAKENHVVIDGQTYYGGLNQPNLKFVKVNVDCWVKIFDFLALRDILAMSGTCQRMCLIGGQYFRKNFHGSVCSLNKWAGSSASIDFNPIECNDFLRFVDTIEINFKLEDLRNLSSKGLLSSLTTLHFHSIDLNKHELHGLENIKSTIETVELSFCYIGDNSICKFLTSCPKLKCLRFKWNTFESTKARIRLFQQVYPKLEYLECTFFEDIVLNLPSILKRNPSIKTLRIGADDLLKIPFDTITTQLDCLHIELHSQEDHAVELVNRLKTSHTNGWYKTLRVSLMWTNQSAIKNFINGMATFSALEMLYTEKYFVNICHLTGLKELHLRQLPEEVNLQSIAMNLINLERLWIEGSVNQLIFFLFYTKTLKMVIFKHYNNRERTLQFLFYNRENALNLYELNEVRQISGMKSKVQIGLYKNNYPTAKYKAQNVNYDLVEITRAETIREHFDYRDHQ